MSHASLPLTTIPDVRLGYLLEGNVHTISAAALFAKGRSVIMGVPGAYTPVCTRKHVPDFVERADVFKALGFNQLVCIAPNDPFVLDAWSREVDPQGKIRFISDGNLEFSRELGLACVNHDLFIGERCERYMMIVEDNAIVRFKAEDNILNYTLSCAIDACDAANSLDILMV
jgi:2-Cys peroxiredoxin 5